jgi:predicted PurR-regulated permease PerM
MGVPDSPDRVELTGPVSDQPPALPESPSPFRVRARDPKAVAVERLIVRSSVKVTGAVLLILLAVALLWRLRALLLLVAVALFVAALLHPAANALQRRGFGRTSAVLAVYAALVALVAGTLYLIIHPVYASASKFATDLPNIVRQAQAGRGQVGRLAARFHLLPYVESHAPNLQHAITQLGKPAFEVGKTVVSGLAGVVTIAFISLFVLIELPTIFNNAMRFMPEERVPVIRRVLSQVDRQVTGFMLANFATSVIAGVVVYIALTITGVPFASVLAIWLALVDFLPLIGGLIGGVPAILVAFLHSVTAGVVTLAFFLVYQQIENHFLNPIIISRTVRLNPLWVLVAVLFGAEIGSVIGSTFGAIVGAIFAVPVAGSIQVAGVEYLAAREARIENRQD